MSSCLVLGSGPSFSYYEQLISSVDFLVTANNGFLGISSPPLPKSVNIYNDPVQSRSISLADIHKSHSLGVTLYANSQAFVPCKSSCNPFLLKTAPLNKFSPKGRIYHGETAAVSTLSYAFLLPISIIYTLGHDSMINDVPYLHFHTNYPRGSFPTIPNVSSMRKDFQAVLTLKPDSITLIHLENYAQ